MKSETDKRVCERRYHTALIEFSYFNKEHRYNAQTLNHCDEGLCFKSHISLQPGAGVYITVKKLHPNGSCNGACRGLRSVTLAEVKWCKGFFNEIEPFYVIGAKYYQPDY